MEPTCAPATMMLSILKSQDAQGFDLKLDDLYLPAFPVDTVSLKKSGMDHVTTPITDLVCVPTYGFQVKSWGKEI